MISKEEVEHIAKLARLELTGKEVEKLQKDMSAILDYFALLQKAPKAKKVEKKQADLLAMRGDKILPRDASLTERIIKAAPETKDDYIKVKTIL